MGILVKRFLFISVVLILAGAAFAGDKHICSSCNRTIDGGRYLEVEGKYFHPDHFKCANCKIAIGSKRYYENDGKFYDDKCYTALFVPQCGYCHESIVGRYFENSGKRYHAECFQNNIAPKCAECRKPILAEYTVSDAKSYHAYCYNQNVALRCTLCGDVIEGAYLKDNWDNAVHKSHQGEIPQCEYCHRFISESSDGGQRYADGRHICGLCHKSAVSTPSEAKQIMYNVIASLANYGIVIDMEKLPLQLVDKDDLVTEARKGRSDLLGLTKYDEAGWLGGLVKTKNLNILMLDGLPRTLFTSALAHELMHVWQYMNAPLRNNPSLCEGSCNYAAYLILREIPGSESRFYAENMMKDKDPDYGEGFRQVKEYVEANGIPAWLHWLKENKEKMW
ncbi:MAG: protein DA1 [candidate division Zixibacteria bacterium]|nr:protein DA1 [candidate division Zixibacteria bacterium]